MMNNILIVAGDPNSINSEIIFKSWKKISSNIKKKIIIIGNFNLLNAQSKKLNIKINLKKIKKFNKTGSNNYLSVINLPIKFTNCFDVSKLESSKYVKNSLILAHKLCIKFKSSGFINCPIDKKLIKKKGIHGVTELIAKMNKITKSTEVMMLYSKKIAVVPITTHIMIKDISKTITKKAIVQKITTLNKYYQIIFKEKPKIAVLGLNPHNSELSKNSEEIKKIIPAILYLKKKVNIDGPFVSDSFFINDYKKYNVITGMYHDQVLIPFKNLCKFDGINITLGLKYIRVSPDHGTAKNLIGGNKANSKSLIECINFLDNLK